MAVPVLTTRQEALAWLRGQGAKISHGKFYGDVKRGLLAVNERGEFTPQSLRKYLGTLPRLASGGAGGGAGGDPTLDAQQRKLNAQADAHGALAQLKLLELREREGRLVPRETLALELTRRAHAFAGTLRRELEQVVPRLATLFGMDEEEAVALARLARGAEDEAAAARLLAGELRRRVPEAIVLVRDELAPRILAVYARDDLELPDLDSPGCTDGDGGGGSGGGDNALA